jgi:hypothetical protein
VRRFCGIAVAPAPVARTLERAGVQRPERQKKARRSPPAVRFFERARPNQLWQRDIIVAVAGQGRAGQGAAARVPDGLPR